MTRRRPEKRTIVETPPTMAELTAEATARVFAPVSIPIGRFCGWCVNRDAASGRTDGNAFPTHAPCGEYRCECACRIIAVACTATRSLDEHITAALDMPVRTTPADLERRFGVDPREGSGVRDAISQTDPDLLALLG